MASGISLGMLTCRDLIRKSERKWYVVRLSEKWVVQEKVPARICNYEVHVKGQVVNPVNYYFMDLSAEDYEKMIQLAANHGKVFD